MTKKKRLPKFVIKFREESYGKGFRHPLITGSAPEARPRGSLPEAYDLIRCKAERRLQRSRRRREGGSETSNRRINLRASRVAVEDLAIDRISPLVAQQLEYARVILWDTTSLSEEALRLFLFFRRTQPIGVVRCSKAAVPIELLYYPAEVEYDDQLHTLDHPHPRLQEYIRKLLNQASAAGSMQAQWLSREKTESRLLDAFRAIMQNDHELAIRQFRKLVMYDPANAVARLRLGVLQWVYGKSQKSYRSAAEHLDQAALMMPTSAAAWRELGILAGKMDDPIKSQAALELAVSLDPTDFDALGSLGGALKRRANRAMKESLSTTDHKIAGELRQQSKKFLDKSLAYYRRACNVSREHLGPPFPLLNMIRLDAIKRGDLDISGDLTEQLNLALRNREKQSSLNIEEPWCWFDLVEIHLYLGEPAKALEALNQVRNYRELTKKMIEPFRESLRALRDAGLAERISGLQEVLELTEQIYEQTGQTASHPSESIATDSGSVADESQERQVPENKELKADEMTRRRGERK